MVIVVPAYFCTALQVSSYLAWAKFKASNFDLAQRLAADNLYAGTPQTHRTGCWAPVPAGLRVVTGELVFLTGF